MSVFEMRSNALGSKELSSRLTDCLLLSGVMPGKCGKTRPKVEAQPGEIFENQDRSARLWRHELLTVCLAFSLGLAAPTPLSYEMASLPGLSAIGAAG
jgi:hypothetical protein